jgi:ATP-dependent Lhr-like helicase
MNDKSNIPTKHPRLLKLLTEGGASFLTRLSREENKAPSELLVDLLDLVWEGRVSNDQFAPLRLHANPKTAKHANWVKTGSGLGRWYATETLVEEEAISLSKKETSSGTDSPVLQWTYHLIQVYGIINKDLVASKAPFSWDTVYPVLKRLEEWGTLTRGTFIKGMSNLQFTTHELSDAVRQSLPDSSDTSPTILSSADPANPFGIMIAWPEGLKGASFARKPGNYLVLKGDRWLYWIESNGKRVFRIPKTATDVDGNAEDVPLEREVALLQAAIQSIIRRQKLVKIVVELWNGDPVAETAAGKLLLKLGAERDLRSLVFWSK